MTHARSDEDAVRATIARLANTLDTRRWSELRALFADEVTTDYTSLFGGDVQRQRGDDLIQAWRTLLSPLDATQHMVGGIDVRVDGRRARAECHVRGYHILSGAPGGGEWMVAGHWVVELDWSGSEWLIAGMTLRTFYQTGNRNILSEAAAK